MSQQNRAYAIGMFDGVHLGHLKWTLETFLKAFFERRPPRFEGQ